MILLGGYTSLLLGVAVAGSIKKRSSPPGFDYQNDKVRGVSLGGWLVTEPFITPSLYQDGFDSNNLPVDEFHLTQMWGKETAQQKLEQHWSTWITEDDIQQISQWGFNTVRIPIGYWAFMQRDEDPYIQGQVPYLNQSLQWARNNNIKVWIDLHGVPGSQNGFDNSGLRDTYLWQSDQYGQNIADTRAVLEDIVYAYGGPEYYDVVSGIELVNEPLGPILNMTKLTDYYNYGYNAVRNVGDQNVIVHDAFLDSDQFINNVLNEPDYWNVVADHHRYQIFSVPELQRSPEEHIQFACGTGANFSSEPHWRVVGEWAAAMTDCQPQLNGVYVGSRYDGSYDDQNAPIGSCEGYQDITTWPEQRKQDLRKYVEAQLDAWELGSGWILWTYKTENSVEWDVGTMIRNGLFPQPLTDRQYPNQCGY